MRQFANSCSGRLAAGIAATALLLAAGTAAAQEYNWTFQTSETAGEPTFEIKQEWAQMVEEMTGGRIHIEILPVGAVVPHSETLDAVGAGILQGHLTDPSYFAGRDPAFAMLGNAQLAEDVAQEAFLEAYINLAKLETPAAFPGWFRAGARRCRPPPRRPSSAGWSRA